MGYLTTITFRNDGYGDFKKHHEETIKGIIDAMDGIQKKNGDDCFSVGSFANPVVVQKPRHASETTLYLFAGNTMVDVDEAKSEWAINAFLQEMKYHTKRLKELKKEDFSEEKIR